MNGNNEPLILIFSKLPGLAKVKTRLLDSTPLSEEECVGLATAFLVDTLEAAIAASNQTVTLAIEPALGDKEFGHYLRAAGYSEIAELAARAVRCVSQGSGDFAQRLFYSLEQTREQSAKPVLLLGSDCPALSPALIQQALEVLANGDLVLGPTPIGGLYLIGIPTSADQRELLSANFFGRNDSTELAAFQKWGFERGFSITLLEMLFDIDVAEDLVTFLSLYAITSANSISLGKAKATLGYLKLLSLKLIRDDSNNRVLQLSVDRTEFGT